MKKKLAGLLIVLLLSGCASGAGEAAVPEQIRAPAETAEATKPKMRLVSVTIEGIAGDIHNTSTQEFHYDDRGFLQEMVSCSGDTEVSSTYAPVEQEG